MTKRKRFLSPARYAEMLREAGEGDISARQVRRLCASGQLKARKTEGLGWSIAEDARPVYLSKGRRTSIEEDPEKAMRETLALARFVLGSKASKG